MKRKYKLYSYKFPDDSIYVGYTPIDLDYIHYYHSTSHISPISHMIKKYPDVYPKVELVVENVTYDTLHKLQRKIFDSNSKMKILNVNLWLYGY